MTDLTDAQRRVVLKLTSATQKLSYKENWEAWVLTIDAPGMLEASTEKRTGGKKYTVWRLTPAGLALKAQLEQNQ